MSNMKNTKEHQISRQSQIKTMLEFSALNNQKLDLKTLVGGAELLTDWVVNGYSKELGERLVKLQEHINQENKGGQNAKTTN